MNSIMSHFHIAHKDFYKYLHYVSTWNGGEIFPL